MKHYKFFSHIICSLVAILSVSALTFQGCTKVDDSLGEEYIPNHQQMKVGYRALNPCFKSRLYRTDSLRSSNLGTSLMGSTINDTFGIRKAGFFSQFTWGSCPDSTEGFGYRPIFDSLMIALSVKNYDGDTTKVRTYEVYEVVNDEFITNSEDTLFYGNFDITPYLKSKPLFTFDFPDQQRGIYTTSTLVKMTPSAEGMEFIERLMLLKGAYTDNNLDGYFKPEEWLKNFKGIYVTPKEVASDKEQNSIFEMELSNMGMLLYGRNRNKIDPTLIQDTTYSLYYFYDETKSVGNVSINTIEHDYSGSLIGEYRFDESESERDFTTSCFVEGMGGIATELLLGEEFITQIEEILSTELDPNNIPYNSIAFNQATLSIYDRDVSYDVESGVVDWTSFYPTDEFIDRMDNSIERLGLYSIYKGKSVAGIPDYDYVTESSYGTTLNYNGFLNRSKGCYVMDISMYLQRVWNKYIELKEKSPEASTAEIMKEMNQKLFSIYLAPEAYSLNTFKYSVMQGMDDGVNTAPIKLDITYTLIK